MSQNKYLKNLQDLNEEFKDYSPQDWDNLLKAIDDNQKSFGVDENLSKAIELLVKEPEND